MKYLLYVFCITSFLFTKAQVYTITYIKGNIKCNNQSLKYGDVIHLTDKLYCDNPCDVLKIVSSNNGSQIITFQKGTHVNLAYASNEHSELYEYTLGEYLNLFQSTSSALTTRGIDDFDWFTYFTKYDDSLRQNLIISGEKVPLISPHFTITNSMQLYACVFNGKDSLLNRIPIVNDSLLLDYNTFALKRQSESFTWKLKLGIVKDGNILYRDMSGLMHSYIMDSSELSNIIYPFYLSDERDDNKQNIDSQINNFMAFNYGKFSPIILKEVKREIKTNLSSKK
ncbi:MAG TPA: hypothetical protein VK718_03385 [Ferruginibacter sp.]|jgi:hypothetical protein|nr:hypothetical protein [Ferruginibacter sp.]